jgi:hypothetical protein
MVVAQATGPTAKDATIAGVEVAVTEDQAVRRGVTADPRAASTL